METYILIFLVGIDICTFGYSCKNHLTFRYVEEKRITRATMIHQQKSLKNIIYTGRMFGLFVDDDDVCALAYR
jgi:hypothetical protein